MHPLPLKHLSEEALRRIRTKPESEIGGLLWGRLLPGSVLIEEARLLDCTGSLFNAIPAHTRELEQAIERNHPSGLELVGYFRSHIRDGLSLSTQDQWLITKCLRNPEYLFLLIRPFEIGCMGAFFFWQNGHLQTDGNDPDVPFILLEPHPILENEVRIDHTENARLTEASKQNQNPVASAFDTAAAVHIAAEHRLPEQPQASVLPARAPTRFWFALTGIALLIAFVAAIGTAMYFSFPLFKAQYLKPVGALAATSEVGLKVARVADGHLDVTWNRNILGQAGAQQAVLTIIDGSVSKHLTINRVQWQSGNLSYFPTGSDVVFRCEINLNAGHSIADSVHVVLPTTNRVEHPATFPTPRAISKHPLDSEKANFAATPHPSIASRTPFKMPAYTSGRDVLQAQHDRERLRAPTLQLDPAAATYTLPSSLASLPSPPAPSSAPGRDRTPVQPPAAKLVSGLKTAAYGLAAYVPPRPVRQVMPDITPIRYALASQTGKVEVQVTINESGHVTDARCVQNGTEFSSLLVNAAVAAARQWIFQPATLHGKPVAAEHRVVFNFESP